MGENVEPIKRRYDKTLGEWQARRKAKRKERELGVAFPEGEELAHALVEQAQIDRDGNR